MEEDSNSSKANDSEILDSNFREHIRGKSFGNIVKTFAFLIVVIYAFASLNGWFFKFLLVIVVIVVLWLFFANTKFTFSYEPNVLPCIYCDKPVEVKTIWKCDYCYFVNKGLITNPCSKCGVLCETAFCEHCHQEFKL